MVVKNANIDNIMKGMESTGGVRLHNHRRKLKQRFDIIRKLGQGTYGKVQLGINKETGQEVAIKTIKKAKIETEADLVRIRREIQIMSSVQHPNIIHIYEVFENREKMVLVMEYAAGGELYDYLNERKVLSQDEARRIFRQIATAVYYCHKHKICHRDLKLENILLDEQGSAKIADFGLSNVFDEKRLLNTFCGSPLYASPEIVKGTPYYGPEVDCWSLGVLLYTLVYGAMPFDGSNFKRLVKQISQGDYFEPKKTSPASSLIREMLAVSPAKRADIEKVCSHWWVNEGYTESCFDIAEELASQTPVRLDLLLSLAPAPSGVSTENIMQQGLTPLPPVSHSDMPVRCHSMGSLMDMNHTPNEQSKLLRKQSFLRSGPVPVQYTTGASTDHSAKRKLEEGASCSDINLKEIKHDEGNKRNAGNYSNDQAQADQMSLPDPAALKPNLTDERMDVEQIADPPLETSCVNDLTESNLLSKDSGVDTQDEASRKDTMITCESSTSTIVPVDSLSPSRSSFADESGNELAVSDSIDKSVLNKDLGLQCSAVTQDSENVIHRDGAETSVKLNKDESSAEKNPSVLKESNKTLERRKEKVKKTGSSSATPDISKGARSKTMENSASASPKSSVKSSERASNKTAVSLPGADSEVQKSNIEVSKEKGDLPSKTVISNAAEPSSSPSRSTELKSKAVGSTENLKDMSSNSEMKTGVKEKPKKLFIPGVKVSDFKKAFERKLSSPEISAVSFGRRSSMKSDDPVSDKSDTAFNVSKSSESQRNVGQTVISQSNDSLNNVSNTQVAKPKMSNELDSESINISKNKQAAIAQNSEVSSNSRSALSHLHAQDETRTGESNLVKNLTDTIESISRENVPDTDKVKPLKSSSDSNRINSVISSTFIGSPSEGKDVKKNIQAPINTNDDNCQRVLIENKPEESKTVSSPQSKPAENSGNKKRSKVEITLKSATLPRRKTSKAEIKLDPAIPPIEYKTEIEHMVNPPTTIPFPEEPLSEEISGAGSAQSFRSWSLEPEGSPQNQGRPHECIIPIQIESGSRENPNLGSPTSGRPPAYPFQQRSNSQTQRSRTLLHQSSSQESDSVGGMEKIRKSPREYIIPIAMEGGGYVTPRATSLEPSTSDDGKSHFTSSRSNHFRRMSSLLSDTSEDEGLNVSSPGLQRHGSLNRDRDEARNFHFHRLRSSRPMRNTLERNDSLSSAEEDDDDDEGFEILTAESLFSTLLSRVRSLTQRLTVEDAKAPGFPSNHFVNQMSNIGNTSRPWKRFYEFQREPLSRRLSETSSFSRLLNYGGEHGPENGRGLSRDSSNSSNTNTESSCTMRTFPRGASYLKGSPSEPERREVKRSLNPLQLASRSRGNLWQEELGNNNLASFGEPSFRNSSSTKSMFQSPAGTYQSNNVSAPRNLIRTHSLRAASEDRRLSDVPLHRNYSNKFSSYPKSGQCNQIGVSDERYNSFSASNYQKGKQKYSLSRGNLTDSTSSLLNQKASSSSKNSNIPSFSRSKLQNPISMYKSSEKDTNNTRDESHRLPKHCSSLPSLPDVPKRTALKRDEYKTPQSSNKFKSKVVNIGNSHKSGDKKTSALNSSEVSLVCNETSDQGNAAPTVINETKKMDKNDTLEECSHNAKGDIKLGNTQSINSSPLKSDSGVSSKFCKQQTTQKSSLPKKNKANLSTSPVSGGMEKIVSPNPQERRKSRFLRPDFFDTPPEESAYVKERENKKAAEAELKKARRLSRRAVSMREICPSGTHDGKKNPLIVSTTHENKDNEERFTDSTTTIKKGIRERKSPPKNCPSQDSGYSKDMKSNKPVLHQKLREGDKILGGTFPSPKTRVEKNILSLAGKNSFPWDMKMIATESTYLKRAVSVDDVSILDKQFLSRSNAKLGGKISSVLKLFSKSDIPELSKQHSSPRIFGNNENGKTNKDNANYQFELKETPETSWVGKSECQSSTEIKQSHSAQSIPIEMSTKGINTRFLKSPFKSIENSGSQKSNDIISGTSRIILDDTKPGKGVSSASTSNERRASGSQNSLESSWSQACKSPTDGIGYETKSENLPVLSLPTNSQNMKLCKIHSEHPPETFDYMDERKAISDTTSQAACFSYNANRCANTSPINEIEHADSCSDCSNINTPDNVSVCADDVDKDIESVEDRIRRKSFYTRFNDVKKKVRKKSPQLFKEARSTPSPSHHNVKNNENQTFLQQNTGGMPEKTLELGHSDQTHDIFSEISSNTLATYQDVVLGNPLESLSTNSVRDENDIVCTMSNGSTTIPTFLRPAAFVQSVLDISSPSELKSFSKKETNVTSNSEDISSKKNDTSTLQNTKQTSPSSS